MRDFACPACSACSCQTVLSHCACACPPSSACSCQAVLSHCACACPASSACSGQTALSHCACVCPACSATACSRQTVLLLLCMRVSRVLCMLLFRLYSLTAHALFPRALHACYTVCTTYTCFPEYIFVYLCILYISAIDVARINNNSMKFITKTNFEYNCLRAHYFKFKRKKVTCSVVEKEASCQFSQKILKFRSPGLF